MEDRPITINSLPAEVADALREWIKHHSPQETEILGRELALVLPASDANALVRGITK